MFIFILLIIYQWKFIYLTFKTFSIMSTKSEKELEEAQNENQLTFKIEKPAKWSLTKKIVAVVAALLFVPAIIYGTYATIAYAAGLVMTGFAKAKTVRITTEPLSA